MLPMVRTTAHASPHTHATHTDIGEGAGSKLFEIKTPGLEARFFGGVTLEAGDGTSTNNTTGTGSSHGGSSASGGSGRHPDSEPGSGKELQTVVGEGYTPLPVRERCVRQASHMQHATHDTAG
jgi:hypothetical protein